MSIENIGQQLDKEITDLQKVRAALTGSSGKPTAKRKKRVISAMARRRMAKAQKARWAKFRAKARTKRKTR